MSARLAQAVTRLLKDARRWEIRSAGRGSKGDRWYAWAWLGIASPCHHLLIRRRLRTGELAFHYCHVPVEEDLCATRRLCAVRRWESKEVRDLLAGLSQQPGRS